MQLAGLLAAVDVSAVMQVGAAVNDASLVVLMESSTVATLAAGVAVLRDLWLG